jgi:hypothetical protein
LDEEPLFLHVNVTVNKVKAERSKNGINQDWETLKNTQAGFQNFFWFRPALAST